MFFHIDCNLGVGGPSRIFHRRDRRVMGREVSCEIALKKGSKREVKGRDQGGPASPRPNQTNNTSGRTGGRGGGEEVASSYGGSGAPGRKAPVTTLTSTAGSGELSQAAASASKESAVEDARDKREKGAGKNLGKAGVVEGEQPTGEKRVVSAEEAGEGLSKKDARKLARKVMKKERKAKAKERAKDKKEAQAKEEAAAVKVEVSVGGADPKDEGGDDRAEGEADAEEPMDPKAAKLMADARTLLVFGVADGLTAKQLQKRVKKVRRRRGVV